MAWRGLEWPGVAWSGLEQPGVAWSGLELPGAAWSGLEWPGVAWSCLEMPGVKQKKADFSSGLPPASWPSVAGHKLTYTYLHLGLSPKSCCQLDSLDRL